MRRSAAQKRFDETAEILTAVYLIVTNADEFVRYISEIAEKYRETVKEAQGEINP